jgi:hypothetical protein
VPLALVPPRPVVVPVPVPVPVADVPLDPPLGVSDPPLQAERTPTIAARKIDAENLEILWLKDF